MPRRHASIFTLLASPALALVVIAGVFTERGTYKGPQDFEPFHRAVAELVSQWPMRVGSWYGSEVPVPPAAQVLLRPNALRCILYSDFRATALNLPPRSVQVVVVACKSSADMGGHYPPNCYPNEGFELRSSTRRRWTLPAADARSDDLIIEGMEYDFLRTIDRQPLRRIVYNFMIVPRRGIFPDINGVRQAAEDYQQRFYGAAQVQVVFTGPMADLDVSERDQILEDLLRPAPVTRLLDTLLTGVIPQ